MCREDFNQIQFTDKSESYNLIFDLPPDRFRERRRRRLWLCRVPGWWPNCCFKVCIATFVKCCWLYVPNLGTNRRRAQGPQEGSVEDLTDVVAEKESSSNIFFCTVTCFSVGHNWPAHRIFMTLTHPLQDSSHNASKLMARKMSSILSNTKCVHKDSIQFMFERKPIPCSWPGLNPRFYPSVHIGRPFGSVHNLAATLW